MWLTEPLVEVGIKNPSLGFVNKECAVQRKSEACLNSIVF